MVVARGMYDHMEIERVVERGLGAGKEVIESSVGLRMDDAWVAGEDRLCRTWRLVRARRDSVPVCRGDRGDLLDRSPGCVRSLYRSLLRSLYLCLSLFHDNEVDPACKVDDCQVEATSKTDGSAPMDPDVC
jgi:hypothetical protein